MPKKTLGGLLAVLLLLLTATAAPAKKVDVLVGIANQHDGMFRAKAYKALHLHRTRFFIRWDAIRHPYAIQQGDAFVNAARASGVKVLMHVATNNYTHGKAKLPSVKAYKRDVGKLIKHYRKLGVTEWGVWNEVNHVSEPTYKNPKRAAQFFAAMKGMCKGCTIVALDLLDQKSAPSYINRWFKNVPRKLRRGKLIVGIHNYGDVNRLRTRGTLGIIRGVRAHNRRAKFWLTETGGLVRFGKDFPCSEKRAANRLGYMFRLARKYRGPIDRLYVYGWSGSNCKGFFDVGLVRRNGTPRPGYKVVKKNLKSFAH